MELVYSEANTLLKLKNDFIICLKEHFRIGQSIFLVMDYADGGDLLFLANITIGVGSFSNISFGRAVSFLETNDNKLLAAIADNERNVIYLFDISALSTSSNEILTSQNKELLNVVDVLGRETSVSENKLLLYIFSDGSVEKRIIIE